MLTDLRHETALQHAGRERNQVAPEQGRFLAWLLETLGARRIIEVGVFTGYSSLAMALVRHLPVKHWRYGSDLHSLIFGISE